LIWDRKETKSATFYYKSNSSVLLRRSQEKKKKDLRKNLGSCAGAVAEPIVKLIQF